MGRHEKGPQNRGLPVGVRFLAKIENGEVTAARPKVISEKDASLIDHLVRLAASSAFAVDQNTFNRVLSRVAGDGYRDLNMEHRAMK